MSSKIKLPLDPRGIAPRGGRSGHAAESQGSTARDAMVALLRRAMPFQIVPDRILAKVAALARLETYGTGRVIYRIGEEADALYVIVSGRVQHNFGPAAQAEATDHVMAVGEVFGWAALLEGRPGRLASATTLEKTELISISGEDLLKVLEAEPGVGDIVMSRFATLINQNFKVPESVARVRGIPAGVERVAETGARHPTGLALTMFRLAAWLRSPKPYLMVVGFALLLGFWYFAVEVWKLPRFREMPGLTTVFKEWTSREPVYGLSLYTPEYYQHIWVSVRRIGTAFLLATMLGVPLGLFLGWSRKFREYVFPVFEMLRPIPILAWVPLSILMFKETESSVIFLTFLASFFATALNTMLGVESIDESYTRAASCLGANRWQSFVHVIVPGALPFVFTGLQISVGVAWFSLVAAEMVSGQFGLGYVINTSYTMVRYPTIVIGMITLGAVGYSTSAVVRMVGDYMMQWRVRELALGGR